MNISNNQWYISSLDIFNLFVCEQWSIMFHYKKKNVIFDYLQVLFNSLNLYQTLQLYITGDNDASEWCALWGQKKRKASQHL